MTTLEKIRTEIAEIAPLDYPCDKRTPERIRDMAVEIVEKYAEQEPCDDDYQTNMDEALKQAKRELCDDVVSRESVKELIKSGISTDTYEDIELVCKWVDEMPPVRPQEQTGHWILLDECANSGYYCSNCQKKLVKEGWSQTVKKIKYCPNCGAKMVEPQERSKDNG